MKKFPILTPVFFNLVVFVFKQSDNALLKKSSIKLIFFFNFTWLSWDTRMGVKIKTHNFYFSQVEKQ